MKAVRRVLTTILMFVSWGLALYLFYAANILGGFGALVSVFFFAFGVGFGEAFATRYGYDAIKKAREEGRAEGEARGRKEKA